jgi:endonuclease-3 related protein
MDGARVSRFLQEVYRRLLSAYGPQHWWPAEEPFEVMLGAVLTQSAAWHNVEKAIANLKAIGALSPAAIRRLSLPELAQTIRPCGYYNAKAYKLKSLACWLEDTCADDLGRLFAIDTDSLREMLLAVRGIGQETTDSILLYAAGKPVFIIDAYTRRIVSHLGIAPDKDSYTSYQRLFMAHLPADAGIFNEYHALLVRLGKDACHKKPLCRRCCLSDICRSYRISFSFSSRTTSPP